LHTPAVPLVVAERLSKIFRSEKAEPIPALQDLSLEIAEHDFFVLAGPSGSGKTTFLRLLAGLETPSGGKLSISGRSMAGVSPRNRDVAMVFQTPALFPHMTARENIAFGLKIRSTSGSEINQRVGEAVEILGLGDCLDRRPEFLSGGERQRVALGRAIVRRPKLLLFDEPLSNLDAPLRSRMRTELARLHAQLGWTSVYVTHDQAEAMSLATRLAVLDRGLLQQLDDPLKVYRQPANVFTAQFVGSPGMNVIPFDDSTLIGVRPEDLSVVDRQAKAGPQFSGTLEFIERLGAENIIHLNSGGAKIIWRVNELPPGCQLGTAVTLSPRGDTAVFFDRLNGNRIEKSP
jgi:multiple sugar transport system ATP-binding protein